MSKLSAEDSALLAAAAYSPLNSVGKSPHQAATAALGETLRSRFEVSSGLTGVTGLNLAANFGFTAFGKGCDQGTCVVAVRGTNFSSLNDWLTNVRMANARSSRGYSVHAGFNALANTLLPQVRGTLRGKNISELHLIGHSLGGAAATLVAEALSDAATVYLYTFGAPRAGTFEHAQYLSTELGALNISRVYHDTDPVPMMPIFPYCHTPTGRTGYLLRGCGTIISLGAHGMAAYQSSCKAGWTGMQALQHRRFCLDTVDDLLVEAINLPGVGFLDGTLLRLLNKALGLMLEGAGMAVGTMIHASATVLDHMAISIVRGIQIGALMVDTVETLIRQILRFLGIAVESSVKITTAFLRWVIDKLFTIIGSIARAAVQTLP